MWAAGSVECDKIRPPWQSGAHNSTTDLENPQCSIASMTDATRPAFCNTREPHRCDACATDDVLGQPSFRPPAFAPLCLGYLTTRHSPSTPDLPPSLRDLAPEPRQWLRPSTWTHRSLCPVPQVRDRSPRADERATSCVTHRDEHSAERPVSRPIKWDWRRGTGWGSTSGEI